MSEKKYNFAAFNSPPSGGLNFSAFDTSTSNAPIVEEMHPDIDMSDRFVIKNFGSDPATSVAWLKKQKGDKLQIEDRGGRIVMKRPEEKEWRVLDPDTGFFSTDILRDATDIGWDVVSGLGEGLGTAAAGVSAGLATGGLAAVPAAAATGATLGGASEAIRQSIGKLAGVHGDYDTNQMLFNAAAGGASPLLFGTGGKIAKGLTQEQAKGVLARGSKYFKPGEKVEPELMAAAGEALQASQSGAFGRLGKAIRGKSTGIDDGTVKAAQEMVPAKVAQTLDAAGFTLPPGKSTVTNLDMADIIEANNPGELGSIFVDTTLGAIRDTKSKLQEEYTNALERGIRITKSGKEVPLDLNQAIPDIDVSQFTTDVQTLITKLADDYKKMPTPDLERTLAKTKELYDNFFIRKVMNADGSVGSAKVTNVPLPTAMRLKRRLADEMANYGQTWKQMQGQGQVAGETQQAFRGVERAMDDAIDERIGRDLGQKYRDLKNIEREMYSKFGETPDKAYNTLRLLNTKKHAPTRALLDKFDKKFNTNLKDLGKLTSIWQTFGGAAQTTLPGEGSGKVLKGGTLGAAIGSLAGYAGGSLAGAPEAARQAMAVGGITGSAAGSLATAPSTLKSFLKAKSGAKETIQGSRILRPIADVYSALPVAPQVLPSIWNYMNPTGGE